MRWRAAHLVHVLLEAGVDTVALGHGSLELVKLLRVGGELQNPGEQEEEGGRGGRGGEEEEGEG